MNVPRKHHYVPKFYLEGFCADGGRLHVIDLVENRSWVSSAHKVAKETDFYLLESDQPDPLAIEKFFSKVEGRSKRVIAKISETGVIPDGEDYEALIAFLAIMSVRIPGWLERVDAFNERVLKSAAWYLFADKMKWKTFQDEYKSKIRSSPELTQAEMLKYIGSKHCSITVNQNFRMKMLLKAIDPANFALSRRNWTLVHAGAETKGFICSDRPLSVCWNDPKNKRWLPPTLGMSETSVMFPLNQDTALIGVLEAPLPKRILDSRMVGIFNMWTAIFAKQFVFAPGADSEVTFADGTLSRNGERIVECQIPIRCCTLCAYGHFTE